MNTNTALCILAIVVSTISVCCTLFFTKPIIYEETIQETIQATFNPTTSPNIVISGSIYGCDFGIFASNNTTITGIIYSYQ